MNAYDRWLEQPRVDADRDAAREEAIDGWLSDEYDEACRTRHQCDLSAGLLFVTNAYDVAAAILSRDDCDALLRDVILAAYSPRGSDDVDSAVERMVDAGRQAYIANPRNRERALQAMEDAGRD